MVAQVDAAGEYPEQRIADRKAALHLDPGFSHRHPMRGPDERARPEVVDHNTAGDAARGRSLHRLDHLAATVVGEPDVEEQVHMLLCCVDVGDQGVDRRVRIRQQPPGISADRPKAADGMAELEEIPVALGNDLFGAAALIFGHPGQRFAHPRRPPPADVHLAKQQIGDDADHRQRADDYQPGNP